MLKTISRNSYQSIKDASGSIIMIRKSRLNPSLYRFLLQNNQNNSQNQSKITPKGNIKIVDDPKPKESDYHAQKMLNEYEDDRFSLANELENPLYKRDVETQTSLIYPRPKSNYHNLRWIITFCDCMMQLSKFYCMDSASALQTYFQSGELDLSSTEYNLFYSIFAYLFFLPFLSGYLTDKLGVRFCLFFFCFIQTAGHILFMFGGTYDSFTVMLLGRLFFGLGALCVEVCEDVVVSTWFFDKELTLALGLNTASCRLGTALTSVITPLLMQISGKSYFLPLFGGTILSIVGFLCCLLMIYIDRKYRKFLSHDFLDSFIDECSVNHEKMKFSDIKELGRMFWLIVLCGFLAYIPYFSFGDNGNDILCTLYSFTPQKAGYWLTIVYLISAVFIPIFGYLVDQIGKRVLLLMIALVSLIAPHVILAFMPEESVEGWLIFSLIFIGVFFSLFGAVFWSCIPLVVDDSKKGIAFGIVYSTLNVVLVIASLFIGILHDLTEWWRGGYECCLFFMIACLILSVFVANKIKKLDVSKGNILNSVVTNTEIREQMNFQRNETENLLELIEKKREEFLEMKEVKKK